jgi:hypothetical protein
MTRFPHEFTMKKYHLIESDLNEDAYEALQDFEKFLSHIVDLKSKAGEAWVMTQAQQKKLNRLSRAVCMEIEYMVEEVPDRVKKAPMDTVKEVPDRVEKAPMDTGKEVPVDKVKEVPKEKKKEKPTTSNEASKSPFDFFNFS